MVRERIIAANIKNRHVVNMAVSYGANNRATQVSYDK